MPPVIDETKCTGCGRCVDLCSPDVFFGSKLKEPPKVTYPEECWHCNACVMECKIDGAIKLRIPLPLMVLYK